MANPSDLVSREPRTIEVVATERRRTLGINLERLMDAHRMSFGDLAKVMGVSRSAVWNIVDARVDPKVSTLWPVADFFSLTLTDLFDRDMVIPPMPQANVG